MTTLMAILLVVLVILVVGAYVLGVALDVAAERPIRRRCARDRAWRALDGAARDAALERHWEAVQRIMHPPQDGQIYRAQDVMSAERQPCRPRVSRRPG